MGDVLWRGGEGVGATGVGGDGARGVTRDEFVVSGGETMNFLKIQELMISEHSPMPLALSTIGYSLIGKCTCSQTPLMPQGVSLILESFLGLYPIHLDS
jgi:hypothetical protein